MGFFNSLKEKSKKIKDAAMPHPSSDGGPPEVMEWDQIYVEIDNDANGTVANDRPQSPTQRRRGGRPVGISISQGSTFENNQNSFAMRSYDMAVTNSDGDDDDDTRSFSNKNSATFTSGGGITQNASSRSETVLDNTAVMDEEMPMDCDTKSVPFSITKNGKYLSNNHFANAQLIRWKHAAEEGPCLIQTLVFLAAIASIFTAIYPVVTDDKFWTLPSGICAFHTTTLCLLIITFEIRVWGVRNPMSLRARIRTLLVRHFSILRLVWGRGFLYMFAGSMSMTVRYYPYNYITGGILVAFGIVSVMMGAHAAFNLERLRLSLTDNSYLWNKFVKADTNHDNFIGIDDFSNLIWSLGLELDDSYTYRAFREIDHDNDGLVSFYEFKLWWIASQEDDGTIVTVDTRKTMDMSKASLALSNRKVPDQISTGS